MEGIAALLGSENRSRYRGVSKPQSHQSRYSVQLSENLLSIASCVRTSLQGFLQKLFCKKKKTGIPTQKKK